MILESVVGGMVTVLAAAIGHGRSNSNRLTIIEAELKPLRALAGHGERLAAVETQQKNLNAWLSRVEDKLDRVIESR